MNSGLISFDNFKPTNATNVGYLFNKLESGHVVPRHKDHFKNFAKYYNVTCNKIKRRLVFIEDWKPGHFFQVNSRVFTNWLSGDFVEWKQKDMPHRLNVQVSYMNEIESDKANYDPKSKEFIQKIQRLLGVKFNNK